MAFSCVPARLQWVVGIQWSHKCPELEEMGHKAKPKVMSLGKKLVEGRGVDGDGRKLRGVGRGAGTQPGGTVFA